MPDRQQDRQLSLSPLQPHQIALFIEEERRGRAYRLDEDEPGLFDARLRPLPRAAAGAFLIKIVFWSFAGFGFVQAG